MRISTLVRHALPLLVLATPILLRAQFHEPTQEELKMTADPKAPGAAAVYLNVEQIADDESHYQSFYARIKVLTEKGKELATVELPYALGYYTVSGIQARTIHADGTVVPLTGKPEDLLSYKATTKYGDWQVKRKVFNLPSVEVGSILEYYFQLRSDYLFPPKWEIQRPYFVHKAHYAFMPFGAFRPGNHFGLYMGGLSNLLWASRLPPGALIKSDNSGRRSLDLTDIPPAPNEEWMPPMPTLLYRVDFYYTSASTAGIYWVNTAEFWSKEIDHFAEPTNRIKEAVAGLLAPGDNDLDKAKKLYKAVQALDNTDYSRKKSESERKEQKLKEVKRAADIWAQKSGSSEEMAQLYLALLRGAGLTAYAIKVVDRERSIFDPTYLDFGQLDNTLVILSVGGKEIFLDPGEKMCPFQTLHWRHAGAQGIRQSATERSIKTTPLLGYEDNSLLRTGDLDVDAQGAIKGTLRLDMTGQEALYWRQIALRNDENEAKKQFEQWLEKLVPEGVEVTIDRLQGLDNPEESLVAIVKTQGTLGAATAKRLMLPGFFFETRGSHPFVDQEKRLEPVDMHFPDQTIDQIVYHLPTGLAVEGAPQDAEITWPDHAFFVTRSVPSPGQIILARKLARGFTFAKAEEYQDLRGFYQKVAAADQQQLVLTRVKTEKGN